MREISKPYILNAIIMGSDGKCRLLDDIRYRNCKEAEKDMKDIYTRYTVISAWIIKEDLFGTGRTVYFRSFVDKYGNSVPFNLAK